MVAARQRLAEGGLDQRIVGAAEHRRLRRRAGGRGAPRRARARPSAARSRSPASIASTRPVQACGTTFTSRARKRSSRGKAPLRTVAGVANSATSRRPVWVGGVLSPQSRRVRCSMTGTKTPSTRWVARVQPVHLQVVQRHRRGGVAGEDDQAAAGGEQPLARRRWSGCRPRPGTSGRRGRWRCRRGRRSPGSGSARVRAREDGQAAEAAVEDADRHGPSGRPRTRSRS